MCGSACIRISDFCCGVALRASVIGAPAEDGSRPLLAARGLKLKRPGLLRRAGHEIIGFDRDFASPPILPTRTAAGAARRPHQSRETMMRLSAVLALSARDRARRRGRRVRRRSGKLQDGQILRRRLDRHHRDDRDRRRNPQGSRLHAEDHGSLGSRHLRLDEEQGHRRVPRQLGAVDGERPQALCRGQVGGRDRRQPAGRREIHPRRSAIHL